VKQCDPLPINALAEGYKRKKTSKMTAIRLAKTTEKGLRPFGDRSVELHFTFCFQQNAMGGGGRGLKDTGRGPQESPESRVIADIARDRKSKTSPRMNSDGTDQKSVIGKAKPLTAKDTRKHKGQIE